MEITAIIALFQAAIQAAPKVAELVVKAKEYIAALFGAGLITKDQQDRLFAHMAELQAAALTGNPPPHWTVEPDPQN